MAISIGTILGPINLILAGASLYLLYKNRIKVNPKHRIILDFAAISIICAVFWGILGGTARHIGLLDEATATFLSLILSTLYLIFTFLAVWYFINRFDGGKQRKKR